MWLYIPPIILVVALIALFVIIGKKSAALKKSGALKTGDGVARDGQSWGSRFKKIGAGLLNVLEKTLHFIKFIFRKSEEAITGWTRKIKERRLGKKAKNFEPEKEEGYSDGESFFERGDSEVSKISEEDLFGSVSKAENNSDFPIRNQEIRSIPKEEITIIPAKTEPEIQPEDKVREDALIYRIAENPKDIEAYRELGDYYMSVGNIKDAKDSFKMVLKLRPRDLKAKSSLREIELKMRLGNN